LPKRGNSSLWKREVRRDFIKISLGLWFISMSALLWTD
jgi:hypothetical protein